MTKSKCVLILLLLGSLGVSVSAQTGSVQSLAEAVDRHYNALQSLQAKFVETYRGSGIQREESGTLWLKKPGKMRWDYTSPRQKLFVSDGKTAWFYVPGEARVQRAPVKKMDDLRSPLRYLLGKTKLQKELAGLSLAPDITPTTPGDVVLRGVPRHSRDQISQVLLEITPAHQISSLRLDQTDGSTTEFRFTEQKENVAVADSSFQFSPPAGAEVIDAEDLGN
ncbi:MAG TPA: outer membrane lipoprotein chaperone LolA [Terriglobales bacterium]|nr:outer membrane lipoprotein chaperone LolA [Terriglobales bacterium]